jgi:hypothetical protein
LCEAWLSSSTAFLMASRSSPSFAFSRAAFFSSIFLQDAVGVEGELDLDLRHAARRGRDARELELEPERAVVLRELALALQHVDLHAGLVVGGGGEGLLLARRDGRVLLDELGHHAAHGLDAQAERGDVEQQHVLDVAREHAALDRGADRDDLVGVDALVGLLAEDLLHISCTLGMRVEPPTRMTSSILLGVELGVLERLRRARGALEEASQI